MNAPKLEALQVSKQFGGLNALEEVSLSLVAGEVHGLIGPDRKSVV